MATMKERLDQHDKRLDRHDRQIAVIRSLVEEGMRLVVQSRKDFRKLAQIQIATQEAQQRTEATLQAFITSMRGGNGHAKN